jgi:hypothetical protein
MKNLWKNFVAWLKGVVLPWFKGLLLKLKIWFLGQELVWIKKNWKEIANFLIILIAYWRLKGSSDLIIAFIVKIWLYLMTLYYVLIQGLEINKLFHKTPPVVTPPTPPAA